MIPFNELRIGNYVLVDSIVRKIAMISCIDDKTHKPAIGFYVGEDLHYMNCNNKQLRAVPVNDNLLEDVGFSYNSYFKLWQKPRPVNGTGVELELDREYSVVDFLRRPILKEVKSMHGLQNLYYALQGRELTFKPATPVTY